MTTPTAPTEIKSVADALNQGIALADAGNAPPAPVADDADDGGNDNGTDTTVDSGTDGDGAQDTPAGDTSGDQSGDAGGDAGQDGDGAAATDDAAGADGAGGDDAAGDDADAAGADPAAGKAGEKKVDHFNDPIPNALKPATKERIRFLAGEATAQKQRADTATKERDELITAITETGATPEQYAGVLDYLELVNSNDRNKQIAAINFMYREMAALSRVAGIRVPGITNLSGYPDLEKQVADGKITQELAEEIAASRSATAHQGKVGVAQQNAARQQAEYRRADQQARADMNAMEAGFAKNDPLYKSKKPMIVELLNEMIRGDKKAGIPPLHPSKWPAAYKKIYETLPRTLGGMRPAARPGAGAAQPGTVPKNQPLRAQQPAGAQKQEPKSIEEAVNMGVEMARGG